jgi:hypothetical protein
VKKIRIKKRQIRIRNTIFTNASHNAHFTIILFLFFEELRGIGVQYFHFSFFFIYDSQTVRAYVQFATVRARYNFANTYCTVLVFYDLKS